MSPSRPRPLARRFLDDVLARGELAEGDAVVVALSGGADSVALLHLLRFTPGLPALDLRAAHVDHGMRPDSGEDARWVRGLCRAWGVPLVETRLDPPPASEDGARRARYAFLDGVRRERGARWLATAHHADDQAETVLFRVLRGTGLGGLGGMRRRRAPGLWRPLLPFTRREIRDYAEAHHLAWREDASNALPMARNLIRREVLPAVEAGVAPGARRALAGLARRARWDEAALRSLEEEALHSAGVRAEALGWSVDAGEVARRPAPVRARLVRALARRLGCVPGGAGTRRAVEFTRSGRSGGEVPLGGGVTLRRELDRLLVVRDTRPGHGVEVLVDGPGAGGGELVVGGARFRVTWGGSREAREGEAGTAAHFLLSGLRFPLRLRGWLPGDRVRMAYGSKKLKKVFLERGVPPRARSRTPVLADGGGRVLWVPGVVRSSEATPGDDDETFTIGITHAEAD